MRHSVITGLLTISLLFLACAASAHHPAAGTGFGRTGPIRTLSAETLEKGKWAFSFQMEHFDFDSFSDEELASFSLDGEDAHSADSVTQAFVVLSYGILEDLTVSLKLPYIWFDNIREAHGDEPGEVHVHGDSDGIGDLSLLAQYRFFNRSGYQAAILGGLELPTGRTNKRDIDRVTFDAEFQPGSGSLDPFFGFAGQKDIGRFGLFASLLYTVVTEGDQDTDLGDNFHYCAAFSYAALQGTLGWDLVLELNGEFKQKQETGGVKDPNSGGNTLLLSPGTRITWDDRWAGFVSVGFPVSQSLNGIQTDLDYRLLAGLSFTF